MTMTMYDTTKMTVAEIRQVLIDSGVDEGTVNNIKGKSNLVNMLTEIEKISEDAAADEDILANVEFDEHEDVQEMKEDDGISPADKGWTDHVLSLLDSDEKVGDSPTVDGLRRVALLLGYKVHKALTTIHQTPNPDNDKRAVCSVRLEGFFQYAPFSVDGAADVYWGNTAKEYANHAMATAESRAEGRAYRKLLMLRKVITADEADGGAADETLETGTAGNITANQIKFMEVMARDKSPGTGVNLVKFLNKEVPGCNNIDSISHSKALELFKILSSYQSTGVPEDIQGYDANWKTELRGS